ncbi:hypothetical protein [Paraburkholderia sp. BCC1876]|uniref:hypothetical protein n=1 Tax=Paraburkholderia sp. BCC1876 TaxID=2676303 RepID=UPI001591150C|nr:hypothetical protein [Paraburkholderia sp. BCC1876]
MGRARLTFEGKDLIDLAASSGVKFNTLRKRLIVHGTPFPAHLDPAVKGAARRERERERRATVQRGAIAIGQTFGHLTVTGRIESAASGASRCTCTCTCGGTKEARSDRLRSGEVQSCGCLRAENVRKARANVRSHGRPPIVPIATGNVFGRLTITSPAPKGKRGIERWHVRCACAVEKVMNGATIRHALKSGTEPSCGCVRAEKNAEHMRELGKRAGEWSKGRTVTPIEPGRVFGRLTVQSRAPQPPGSNGRAAFWLCRCECGGSKTTRADSLLQGWTQSCGCMRKVGVAKGTPNQGIHANAAAYPESPANPCRA